MAATSYDSLFPYIMLDVDGAPAPVVTAMINKAARELCLRSSCWYEWEDIPLIANENEYDISSPSGSSVVRAVKYAAIGQRALIPETEDRILENKRWMLEQVGEPQIFYMLTDMTMKVYPIPTDVDAGKIMRVKSSFVPALDATSIPSPFIERYSETLIAGAKASLMAMANKTWSNPQMALVYQGIFDTGVDRARIEVEMSYSPTSLRVANRKFGQLQ